MDNLVLTLIIGYSLGALLGILVMRKALEAEKIYAGPPAAVFQYLACATFSSEIPLLIAGLILGLGFGVVLVALSTFAVTFLLLVIFALIEYGPRQAALSNREDRGWTETDARTSGL